jgi:hypothetical protein
LLGQPDQLTALNCRVSSSISDLVNDLLADRR